MNKNLEELLKDFLNDNIKYPKSIILNILDYKNYWFSDNDSYYIQLSDISILKKELKNNNLLILKKWKFVIENEEINIKFNSYKLLKSGSKKQLNIKNSKNLLEDQFIIALKNNKIIRSFNFKKKNQYDIFLDILRFEEIFDSQKLESKPQKSFFKKLIKIPNFDIVESRKSPFKEFEKIRFKNNEIKNEKIEKNLKESNFTKSTIYSEHIVNITKDEIIDGIDSLLIDTNNIFFSKKSIKACLNKIKEK